MEKANLWRLDESDQGTFGQFLSGGLVLFSGELPNRGNASNISRVPPGDYTAEFTMSPRFGRHMYLVGPVIARLGIRIHSANLMGDAALGWSAQLNGCIAFGERLGWIGKQKALLLSAPAIRRVEGFFGGRPFRLTISEDRLQRAA